MPAKGGLAWTPYTTSCLARPVCGHARCTSVVEKLQGGYKESDMRLHLCSVLILSESVLLATNCWGTGNRRVL